jgi:hypothetical protein
MNVRRVEKEKSEHFTLMVHRVFIILELVILTKWSDWEVI